MISERVNYFRNDFSSRKNYLSLVVLAIYKDFSELSHQKICIVDEKDYRY